MKFHFRTGDHVLVLAGKDKGKMGVVLRFSGKQSVVVQGVNKKSRHKKPNPQQGVYGGVYLSEHPVHISNVRKVSGPTEVSTDGEAGAKVKRTKKTQDQSESSSGKE